MKIRESLIQKIEKMDEGEMAKLSDFLNHQKNVSEKVLERRLSAWRGIYGLLSDPDEYAAFEAAAQRRPLFGGRGPDLEGDDTP